MEEGLNDEIRIVLLGKTGVGKSTLGNNLLGSRIFTTDVSGASVTSSCVIGERVLEDGKKLVIVDTPGLFDTRRSNQETSTEIVRCISLSSPGPHVFLFVIEIGRFTQEESQAISHLCTLFGEHVMKYVVVVFTNKDSLNYHKKTLDTFISTAPATLQGILRNCGSRYVAVNNRAENIDEEMTRVMSMVRKTISSRGGAHYTGQMFEAAEKVLKEWMNRIEQENKRKVEELQWRKREMEKQETWLNKKNTEIRSLEQQMEIIRHNNLRQQARKEVGKKSGLIKNLVTTVASVAFTVGTSVVLSRCSIM